MMKKLILLGLLLLPFSGHACTLAWDYEDSAWLDGFRFYQDGAETGTAPANARTIVCSDAGLTPGPGPITATAYRGTDESPHSDPAAFELVAPGLRITISTP